MTRSEVASIRMDLARIEAQIAELRALVESEAQRCPYRETIAQSRENHQQLSRLQVDLHTLRLQMAQAGATGGGVVAAVVAAVIGIGKSLGWW